MARIYLSAAHKSSGKTTVSIGLCAALSARGMAVQPFKKGPDYIDPLWLSAASGRSCYNLDFWTQSNDEITSLLAARAADANIAVVEGNKGLYDGMDVDGSNSNAAMARLTDSPVVLVIDASGITRGIAPLVQGYLNFDGAPDIRGVILNKVSGPRHEEKLRAVLDHYTDIPVLGALGRDPTLEITERHLGLVPSFEMGGAAEKIAAAREAVAKGVDLDAVIAIAQTAPPLTANATAAVSQSKAVKIGIARDAAFGFYYPDDLDALSAAGAELVFFDLMNDTVLPDLDGLFLGGGFPETHMAELEANKPMRIAIRQAIEGGMPSYAECGGLMYLARRIVWNGEHADMAGAIPADAVMNDKPQGRGYARVKETAAHPWPSGTSAVLPAHEFHYSGLENLTLEPTSDAPTFAYDIVRGHGLDGQHDGLVIGNLVANYTHLRHTAVNPWAARFVAFVADRKAAAAQ